MNNPKIGIQMRDGSHTVVRLLSLIQWKHALTLERIGMRHSKGSVAAHVRDVFGFPATATVDDLQDYVSRVLANVQSQMAADGAR